MPRLRHFAAEPNIRPAKCFFHAATDQGTCPARMGVPMNLLSTVLLALAMSTDAFAAAVVKGAALHKPH